jgi:hypothetical protein
MFLVGDVVCFHLWYACRYLILQRIDCDERSRVDGMLPSKHLFHDEREKKSKGKDYEIDTKRNM